MLRSFGGSTNEDPGMVLQVTFLLLSLLFFQVSNAQNRINRDSVLKVGVYDNPPKIFMNENGEPDGIFIDIINEIADTENLEIDYVYGTWSDLFSSLENGEIAMLPDVAYSAERDSLFQLNSVPFIDSWLEVYTTTENRLESVFQLEGKRIGVLKRSVQEDYLKEELNRGFGINYTVRNYDNYADTVEALHNGEIDAMMGSRFFYFSESYDDDLFATGIIVSPGALHLAFSQKVDRRVISIFDSHISKLRNDSDSYYYEVLRKWLSKDLPSSVSTYLKWVIIGLLLLIIVVFVFSLLLNYEVKQKTAQLELRNRELELAKEKAEESERLKTAFLQNMSHEIRTPMNGILGFMRLLKKDELDSKTRKEYIDIIDKSGTRLLTTINNIVEFSKIRSRIVEINLRKLNVEEIMEYHLKFFQPLATEKNIILSIEKQITGADAMIESDRNMLDGILTNLINNAIKFTKNGKVSYGNYIEDRKLIFYVKDEGAGIPEKIAESIFDPFVQGDQEISRPYEGSGLGLSIVKEYVELLKGKLWLDTRRDKGTVFYFSIPYKKVSVSRGKERQPSSVTFEHKKILVAEDDNISYLLIAKILDKMGLEAVRAKNGNEAIEIIKNNGEISLILMDLKMPGKNGFEAIEEIRLFNKHVPIVTQTAFADSQYKEKAFNLGSNDHLNKPIDEAKLTGILKKFLPLG